MRQIDWRKATAWGRQRGLQHSLRLRGQTGSLLWGYRTAATLGPWRIQRQQERKGQPPQWTLSATVACVDPFQSRQRPLIFTAPRQRGWWCWPIVGDVQHVGPNHIRATLGQPEQ